MGAIKWTTPTFVVEVEEGELENYEEIVITFQGSGKKIDFKSSNEEVKVDTESNTATVQLSQLDSSLFNHDTLVQMNVKYKNGLRAATDLFNINFCRNLLKEEMM